MLEIPRALARQFRAVLRRSLMEADPRGSWPTVVCRADRRGLALEAAHGDLAVRHRQEGNHAQGVINFPGGLLAEMEGRTHDPVTLEAVDPGKGRARWADGAVPRVLEFDRAAPDGLPTLPELPKEMRELPASFLTALGQAARTTARESVRYGLARVQLRGRAGQVIATDGRQLLVQGDFPFPWAEDVLLPRLSAFGHRDLPFGGPVRVGRTADAVLVETGPWTFVLQIDKDSRFPDVQGIIPKASAVRTHLYLDAADAAFLAATLPKLPGRADDNSPVTLDLGTPAAVRARAEGDGQVTEVVLNRSTVSGPPVRLTINRDYLLRAAQLGFTEVEVVRADVPLMCRDDSRCYLWMPLDPKAALPPGPGMLRIESAAGVVPSPPTQPERRKRPMPAPHPNGQTPDNSPANGSTEPERWGIAEVIAETEALRTLLQDASGRTVRLLAALKQQRRKSRAVQQAMQSLKELQFDR